MLVVLARRFRPTLVDGPTVTPKPGMTLTPRGPVRMVVVARDQARTTA